MSDQKSMSAIRAQYQWELRDCGEFEGEGFFLKGAEVPAHWSQMACDIVVGKYFRRTGVPGTGHETSVWQMITRVCETIATYAEKLNLVSEGATVESFAADLAEILIEQKASFNSPVWFNVGLGQKYGISEKGKNYSRCLATGLSSGEIRENTDIYKHPQSSACFIQAVEGDLESIFELLKKEAQIFRYGSGTGTNFSPVPGRAGGQLLSYLDIFDRAAGAIRSGGVTRRAAKMVCLDANHPEIMEFVRWKVSEEEKARALVGVGFSAGIEGEAYRTVSGQNANHSVRVSNKLMEEEGDSSLLQAMASAAWSCGDPGLQFDDTINDWNPCSQSMRIRASNPCSEYMFIDDSACNLASLNLVKFLSRERSLDFAELERVAQIMLKSQEVLVEISGYPTTEIAKNSLEYRPLGLGYTNLGSLLMNMGLPYDSESGRDLCRFISAFVHGTALQASVDMAKTLKPFERFEENKESFLQVIEKSRHEFSTWRASLKSESKPISNSVGCGLPVDESDIEKLETLWASLASQIEKHGIRNAQVTAIAPTGTISMMMDCDTTGIEPEFAFQKEKEMIGGKVLRWVNRSLRSSLENLKYTECEIVEILKKLEAGKGISEIEQVKKEDRTVFQTVSGAGEFGISTHAHLSMMAAAQPFVSGAISKTINMPEQSSVQDVLEAFVTAWKLGLKSIAIYRDGSKAGQPLNAIKCIEC